MKKIILILILMFVCEAYPQIQQYQRGMAKLTVAGGGGLPTPEWELVYDDPNVTLQGDTVTVWTDNIGSFDMSVYTTYYDSGPTDEDSCFHFWGTSDFLYKDDAAGNPFDIDTNDVSIEAWILIPSAITGVILDGTNTSTFEGLRFALTSGTPQFFVRDATTASDSSVYADSVLSSNVWHQVVITWDRSGSPAIYIDSVFQANSYGDTPLWQSWVSIDGTDEKTVGATNSGGTGSAEFYVKRLRIYHVALTAGQVKTLYGEGTP